MVLERRVYVHALESLELLETLETAQNAKGVCALTVCAKPCLLALPSSAASGTLRIHDLLAGGGGSVLSELSAHKLNVASLQPVVKLRVGDELCSSDGSMLTGGVRLGEAICVVQRYNKFR